MSKIKTELKRKQLARKAKRRQTCRLPGTHLNLCHPREFLAAWHALGDLTDEQCERIAAQNL